MIVDIIQDHIHLSDALGDSPEFAPTHKWTVRDRKMKPTVIVAFTETLDGYIFEHVVGNDSPVKRKDFNFEIKCMGDDSHSMKYYEDLLVSLNGRRLYFCDNFHPNDGDDHSTYVKPVVLIIDEIPLYTPGLFLEYIPVTLTSVESPA